MVLVARFPTNITPWGTIRYPTSTLPKYFTTYDPPSDSYWHDMSARTSYCSSLAVDRECMMCSSLKDCIVEFLTKVAKQKVSSYEKSSIS